MKKRLFPLCAALLLGLTACTPSGPTPTVSPPPVMAPASPAPSGELTVHTDWSKLGAPSAPLPEIGARWYENYTDSLIPRSDYGTLIPYAGLRLLDDWPAANGCLFGLMTADGVAVTDPVFSNAYRPGSLPLLVLSKGDPTMESDQWNPANLAIAAADGSWCTGFDYRCLRSSDNGLLLCTTDSLTLMAPDGEILHRYSPTDLGLTQEEFDGLVSDVVWYEGCGGEWIGDYLALKWMDDNATSICLFQVSAGKQVVMLYEDWGDTLRKDAEAQTPAPPDIQSEEGSTVLKLDSGTYTLPYGTYGSNVEVHGALVFFMSSGAVYNLDGKEILPPSDGRQLSWVPDQLLGDGMGGLMMVTNRDGEDISRVSYYTANGDFIPMLDGWMDPYGSCWYRQVNVEGGLIEMLDLNTATYYDADTLECVFRTYLGFDDT